MRGGSRWGLGVADDAVGLRFVFVGGIGRGVVVHGLLAAVAEEDGGRDGFLVHDAGVWR